MLNNINSDSHNDINSELLADINSDPNIRPFAFNSSKKHVPNRLNFDPQLDPGIRTDTPCIKFPLIDINCDSNAKPYDLCRTNSYLHHHSDNVLLNDVISDSLNDINSESHVDINSAPDCKPFFFLSANKHVQSHPNFDAQQGLTRTLTTSRSCSVTSTRQALQYL